jgi:hypothetical protein
LCRKEGRARAAIRPVARESDSTSRVTPLCHRNQSGCRSVLHASSIGCLMDVIAINDLRARYMQAVRAAETYRDAAEKIEPLREFYHALAVTYERAAREMRLMLDAVERIDARRDLAA